MELLALRSVSSASAAVLPKDSSAGGQVLQRNRNSSRRAGPNARIKSVTRDRERLSVTARPLGVKKTGVATQDLTPWAQNPDKVGQKSQSRINRAIHVDRRRSSLSAVTSEVAGDGLTLRDEGACEHRSAAARVD